MGTALTGHVGGVWEVCTLDLEDAGTIVLTSVGSDGTVRMWDVTAFRQLGEPLTGHIGGVYAVGAIPTFGDADRLASAGSDGTVRLWDVTTRKSMGPPMLRQPNAVLSMATYTVHPAEPVQVLAGPAPAFKMWNTSDGTTRDIATGHAGEVSAICRIADDAAGNFLVSGGVDGRLQTLALAREADSRRWAELGIGAITAMCPVPGRRWTVAVAGASGAIHIVDTGHLSVVAPPLVGHSLPVRSLTTAMSPNHGQILASAGQDGAIFLWDTSSWEPFDQALTGHDGWIWSVASGDAVKRPDLLVSGGADGTVRLWSVVTCGPVGEPIRASIESIRTTSFLGLGLDRWLLLSGGHSGILSLWDPTTGAKVHDVPLGAPILSLEQLDGGAAAGSADSAKVTVAVGTEEGAIAIDIHESMFVAKSSPPPMA